EDVRVVRCDGAQHHLRRRVVTQIPWHTIEPRTRSEMERADRRAGRVQHFHANAVLSTWQLEGEVCTARPRLAECKMWREETGRGRCRAGCCGGTLPQRGDITQDVQPPSICRNDDIVPPLRSGYPGHRCRWQAAVELGPVRAVVQRVVKRVPRS